MTPNQLQAMLVFPAIPACCGLLCGLAKFMDVYIHKVSAKAVAQREAKEQREAEKAAMVKLLTEVKAKQHEDAFEAFVAEVCHEQTPQTEFQKLLDKPIQERQIA